MYVYACIFQTLTNYILVKRLLKGNQRLMLALIKFFLSFFMQQSSTIWLVFTWVNLLVSCDTIRINNFLEYSCELVGLEVCWRNFLGLHPMEDAGNCAPTQLLFKIL